MKRTTVLFLLIASIALASGIYPPFGTNPEDYSFDGLASWSQQRIASGTALPDVASATEGDIFLLYAPASTTLAFYRLNGGIWGVVSGGGSGGEVGATGPQGLPGEPGADGATGSNGLAVAGVNQQTATYTVVIGDNSQIILMTTASTTVGLVQSVLIPPAASVSWKIGNQFSVVRAGVGEVRIAGHTGVTVQSTASPTSAPWITQQYGAATAVYLGTDTWQVFGYIKDSLL